ncbi:MAG TPA: peptide chain release factor N(5)-glutamine methyltransferase [Candidatus Acidoferrum sp.]|nr:peptide chain release factor N(5)-glutamine methyltransferase [Candidatus Acidoferrum sp.]
MDIRSALKQGIATLREAHVPSDTLAAEILLLDVLGKDRTWLYAHPESVLSRSEAENYFAHLQLRAAGVPTQHLTGKQEFWGLTFEVNPDVLIPRPETEHLVEVALDRLALPELRAGHSQRTQGGGMTIADVGTGSGCIAIALAKELPEAKIYATDVSPAALAVARRNAERLRFCEHIQFVESNLFEKAPIGLSLDLIVSNPPYIGRCAAAELPREIREHEPEIALYGGEEGYEIYAELVTQSAAHLKPGGLLVLELGHDSLGAVRPLLESPEWSNIGVTNDLAGIPRVISAERTTDRL